MKDWYLDLLKQGWTLTQIDEMDIGYFFELMRHKSKNSKGKSKPAKNQKAYIDDLPI